MDEPCAVQSLGSITLAEILRYVVKLKLQLLADTDDGRLEIDNNPAENALRGVGVGRKNWLFAGADSGGERAASMLSLLETAKLNGVNSQEWRAAVLDRIGKGHPINRIDELLPWNWSTSASSVAPASKP
ncbi:transposase domain-containing protein [Novosphingobium lindaniclasticum]